MDAPEEWRPQIFYTDGTRKGQPVSDRTLCSPDQQEPFPEADHPARTYGRGSQSRPTFMPAFVARNGSSDHEVYHQTA